MIETKTYSDGTTATGTAPLPNLSPAQQDALANKLPDEFWELVDKTRTLEGRPYEIACQRLEELVLDLIAESAKP